MTPEGIIAGRPGTGECRRRDGYCCTSQRSGCRDWRTTGATTRQTCRGSARTAGRASHSAGCQRWYGHDTLSQGEPKLLPPGQQVAAIERLRLGFITDRHLSVAARPATANTLRARRSRSAPPPTPSPDAGAARSVAAGTPQPETKPAGHETRFLLSSPSAPPVTSGLPTAFFDGRRQNSSPYPSSETTSYVFGTSVTHVAGPHRSHCPGFRRGWESARRLSPTAP